MAVTIGGAGTVADGDTDGFDGARNIRTSGRPAAQVENVIDSSVPFVQNRGNITCEISFESSKRYADEATAKAQLGVHSKAVAAATTFSGFGFNLTSAICTVDCSLVGLVMHRSYKISGAES